VIERMNAARAQQSFYQIPSRRTVFSTRTFSLPLPPSSRYTRYARVTPKRSSLPLVYWDNYLCVFVHGGEELVIKFRTCNIGRVINEMI